MAEHWLEKIAQAFERPANNGLGLAELAKRLDPKTIQTPALDLVDAELERLTATPDGRLIISIGPQEGKSSRVAKVFPVARLRQNPNTRIVLGSYGHDLARRNGRAVRDAIISNPALGLRIRKDLSAQNEWQLEGYDGGVYAAGVGTALTGRPADLILLDDPVKDMEEADSQIMRDRVWDWWLATVSTRLAPGAQVVLIMTRWHEDDLVGRILAAEDGHLWRVVNIPAEADHDPNKDEVDLLGREPGEFMVSARGRTELQWQAIKTRVGSRVWASLYQGRPTPAAGGMFKREWFRRYSWELWTEHDSGRRSIPGAPEVCISVDCAFKDLDTSDYFAGQVWMRRGPEVYLLDQIHARLSFPETLAAVRTLAWRWPQAVAIYIEDKANGPAVIQSLRSTVPGLIPVQPEGSKAARAAAVSPYFEAGNVWVPSDDLAPWADGFVTELCSFGAGAKNDDQVDAASMAINRLLLSPYVTPVVEPEEFDEDSEFYRIVSRY